MLKISNFYIHFYKKIVNEIGESLWNVLLKNSIFQMKSSKLINHWTHMCGSHPCTTQGVFTLGVRDSSVKSLNLMLVIWDLNLVTMNIVC